MSDKPASMGDLFRQKRADKAAANNSSNEGDKKSSLLDIQAEQARDQQRGGRNNNNSNNNNNNNRNNNNTRGGVNRAHSSGGGGGGGGANRGGGRRQRGGRQGPDRSSLPVEQGVICSLKENFGFIHCADRPDQVFFHYSELRQGLKSQDLHIDDEVEFRIGEQEKQSGEKKMAAFQVTRLPPGKSIVWEFTDAELRTPVKALVERPARADRNGNATEGTLRVLSETDGEIAAEGGTIAATADGPVLRYLPDEYIPSHESDSTSKNGSDGFKSTTPGGRPFPGSSNEHRLTRGDLVEIMHIMVDRRTKERYAKQIKLVMSERQRHFLEQEKKLMAAATVEHGVITALKGDYGFLKSNKRHEEVYFHFSSIELDGDETDGGPKSPSELVLKEGQEMKFMVVTEGEDTDESGRGRRRVSARKVQIQPKGTVTWHDILAEGVTGQVVDCPQPIDSGHPLETQGKVRLHTPIRIKKKHTLEEAIEMEEKLRNGIPVDDDDELNEDEYTTCEEVLLWSKDSPGGNFSFRGGSSVGLYIQNGDTLLFDVIRDYIGDGGTCRAVPTKYLTPREEEQEHWHLEADDDPHFTDSSKKVRLVDLALGGRAEGEVNALKDAYGFIHFAERPVDVHFKMFQLLPDTLQSDLRRNMGLPDKVDKNGRTIPLKLEIGSEVHFDLSVHGTITHTTVSNAGSKKRQQQQEVHIHERENLKAQRILLLPRGTIRQSFTLASKVKGKICKQDAMQPYVGNVELENPIRAMAPEERHPLVAKMIETFLATPEETKIVYHDLQSLKEDEVVVKMVETLGKGMLKTSHIPVEGEHVYPGLLCIEKVEPDENSQHVSHTPDTLDDHDHHDHDMSSNGHDSHGDLSHDSHDGMSHDDVSGDGMSSDGISNDGTGRKKKSRKKKTVKAKMVRTVRFDKNSLSAELQDDWPPAVDDLVECDVVQTRRTGQSLVENMVIIQRHVPEVTCTGVEARGIVKELHTNRNFGFISVLDDAAHTCEMISFQLSEVVLSGGGGKKKNKKPKIKKGDSVKFTIGNDNNGKHVALNVTIMDSRAPTATPSTNKTEKNVCKGIVLLKPTNVSLGNNSHLKKTHSNISTSSNDKGGRWEHVSVDDDKKKDDNEGVELGYVLLTEDTAGMFNRQMPYSQSNISDDSLGQPPSEADVTNALEVKSEISCRSGDSKMDDAGEGGSSALLTHLHYKKTNIAGGNESGHPNRGDLVTFTRSRGGHGVRDVRIVRRESAPLLKGKLGNINLESKQAKFTADDKSRTVHVVDLQEVLGCDPSVLKEGEEVEGIVYEDKIYGICRICDLYVETKLGTGRKERPKLNLTVKKDRGGKILAQSMMAKGPDGTNGFHPGWTSRLSAFVPEFKMDK